MLDPTAAARPREVASRATAFQVPRPRGGASVMPASGRRLVFVVNDASFFVSHRLPLAAGARGAGYDVHVAVPATTPAARQIEALGFPVHDLPVDRRGANPAAEARLLGALVRLYRRLSPAVVHHVTIKPVIYGSFAARIARVPAVVNAVSGLGYLFTSGGTLARARRAAGWAAYRAAFDHPRLRAIFQNPDDRAAFTSRGIVAIAQTALIRGSGVDLAAFRATPLPGDTPVVVLPARMLWDQGVGEFVDAAQRLRAAGIDARFALVGGTDVNRAAVPAAQLEAWTRAGVVEWWGRRQDMPTVLATSSVVCLPSYREGVPKALLEAAAAARPIVTTDVPGCREVVRHGENGLLVPARNGQALAEALGTLLSQPSLRERMGQRGRELAEAEFSVDQVVRHTLAVYADVLA